MRRGESVARGQDEIIALITQRARERAGQRERVALAFLDGHRVAVAQEREQRLDLVIAVRAPGADVECKIDLGRRRFDDVHERVAAGPLRILASSRVVASGFATTRAAFQA